MKVLVTGFDPFGGEKVNPAYEAVKLLPDTIAGAEIIKIEIPTVFTRSAEVVEEAIKKYEPDMVLDVGQAGGRSCMTVERVAINLKEARIPDNDGEQPFDEPIREDGETAYFSTLPVKAMVENMRAHGIPAVAVVGSMGRGAEKIFEHGIDSMITTVNGIMPLEKALDNAEALYLDAARRPFRMVKVGYGMKDEA